VIERSARRDPGRERLRATAGTRVAVAIATGIVVSTATAFVTPWRVAPLLGWDAAMAVYVGWAWLGVGHLDSDATRRVAVREDSSRAAADLILILANVMNLVGVVLALFEAAEKSRLGAGLINVAVVLSVALSWTAVHTVFALRYARLYYQRGGGIDFGDEPPDYADFAYVAFTLGMTYQVSDTPLTSRLLRRTALRHTLLSYLFGVVIVATTINVIAGLFRI
jgi:uncharacterized membrane protein